MHKLFILLEFQFYFPLTLNILKTNSKEGILNSQNKNKNTFSSGDNGVHQKKTCWRPYILKPPHTSQSHLTHSIMNLSLKGFKGICILLQNNYPKTLLSLTSPFWNIEYWRALKKEKRFQEHQTCNDVRCEYKSIMFAIIQTHEHLYHKNTNKQNHSQIKWCREYKWVADALCGHAADKRQLTRSLHFWARARYWFWSFRALSKWPSKQ